jgi:hypothetical protein
VAGCDDDEPSYVPTDEYSSGYSSHESGSGNGCLVIWTYPSGASVYIDGQYLGETTGYDDFVVEASGGTYKVEIYKNGYNGYLEYVLVMPGEYRTLDVYLQESSGYDPYYEPTEDVWSWDTEPTEGPIYVAATRPQY